MSKPSASPTTLNSIQRRLFRTQLILMLGLALFLGVAGTLINIHFETEKRDRNLQNVAQTIARSPILTEDPSDDPSSLRVLTEYLDSLKETLDDIDVISVVDRSSLRVYHSNPDLTGTLYTGPQPLLQAGQPYHTAYETGPSGTQRRAYAAIYSEAGDYLGFVMAIMLMENIQSETGQILLLFTLITLVAILMELAASAELSDRIKKSLMGYEPDVFTAMYRMRDNILESLDEGILAADAGGTIQFANEAAMAMLDSVQSGLGRQIVGRNIRDVGDGGLLRAALDQGEKEFNVLLAQGDILIDSIPVREGDRVAGAVGILHNRTEYTRLMEDLTGARYLVDSMRANNHDFTNKLHVILGLIQMEMYPQAIDYIQNITMVQRAAISRIMNAVSEPAVAALLIGKTARAAELNIRFVLREGCSYSGSDMRLPAEVLVTVIGNLIDNAFEAMNEDSRYDAPRELLFGIYSRPSAVLITTDDTGGGIDPEALPNIFENGYSTKGEGRGTGLYQVRTLVESLGGRVTVESQPGVGASFSVIFTRS